MCRGCEVKSMERRLSDLYERLLFIYLRPDQVGNGKPQRSNRHCLHPLLQSITRSRITDVGTVEMEPNSTRKFQQEKCTVHDGLYFRGQGVRYLDTGRK